MPVALSYTNGLSNAWSDGATFVPKFVVFLIILIAGWLIAKVKVLGNVVSGLILAFGVIAELDQLHEATNVVNAVLYVALAALVGVVVVAVGGGGIKTMSQRWESVAITYDQEKPRPPALTLHRLAVS